jgi:two-component system OmpR family sensor kinase
MTSVTTRLSRWPLRVRLVIGFSAATFVALVVVGALVYWRVEYALDRGLDTELKQVGDTLGRLVSGDGTVTDRDEADATGVAWQVLDARGRVLDRGGPARSTPLIGARRLGRARTEPHTYNLGDFLPVSPKPYRLRVTPLAPDHRYSLVVAVRRDHRDEALRELLVQLTLAGVAMLVFTAAVGDRLARAALRPVERYRSRAAEIAEGAVDLRLDVPPGRDDEVTRLGHTFNEMLSSLERALDRERAFVNEASHELRTPVTLLISRVQFARRRSRSQEEYEQILADLEIDLGRLAELAEHLLQVGAASDRSVEPRSDLVGITKRVLTQRRSTTPAEVVAAELPDQPLTVASAEISVERILTNLLDNARIHGAPPVTVSVDAPPGWVRVAVSDAGDGMTAELLASATRRFARADEARSRPGSGLGLALVEALVVQAGGSLRLCHGGHHQTHGREVDVGCDHTAAMTVTVLLPLA